MVIKKPNTRTPGLSWPTITGQIQYLTSMHTDHNLCAARCFSENLELHSMVYLTLKHFRYLKLATHFMCSKRVTYKKQKIFFEKQKGFRDDLSYSTPQKSEETRGNVITHPQSHPIPTFF